MIRLNPYLHFIDKAREAMEFYKSVFGGNLVLSTFKEGMPNVDPSEEHKIMHAMLETENGLVLMASDAPKGMESKEGSSISLSLSGEEEAPLKGYWEKLKEGATITMPLEKAPWGDTFGMLTDKYGNQWMVNITGPKK